MESDMISTKGINEDGFIAVIKELNRAVAGNKNYNRVELARKKLDKKHKIICAVSRHYLEIEFYRKGDQFFRINRSAADNKAVYYANKKPYPNPNYREDRESWFGSGLDTRYDCSREQFYEYCQEYPPFFEWLLWNQI